MVKGYEGNRMNNPVYKQLTFSGVNDLYLHPLYGARTLESIKYMDEVARTPKAKPVTYYGHVEHRNVFA